MPVCIVLGCQSLDTTVPLPNSPGIRDKWLEKINRLDYEFVNKARICVKHFCRDDFTVRGKENTIRRLKPTAIPSLYLSNHPMNYYSIGTNSLKSANQQKDKNKVDSDTELIYPKMQVLQNCLVASYKFNSEAEDELITSSILHKTCPIPAPRRIKRPWDNLSSDTILPKPKKRTKFYHQELQSEPIFDESSVKPDDNKQEAAEPIEHGKKQNEPDNESVDYGNTDCEEFKRGILN